MSTEAQHAKDCENALGYGFSQVHRWLDEFAFTEMDGWLWFDMHHRRLRHHREGVEEVRSMWGDEAARAAEIHITADEGKVKSKEEMLSEYPNEDKRKLGKVT